MDLTRYFQRHGLHGERALAAKAGVNARFLYQARTRRRHLTLRMMLRLIEASNYELTLIDLIAEASPVPLTPRHWTGVKTRARAATHT